MLNDKIIRDMLDAGFWHARQGLADKGEVVPVFSVFGDTIVTVPAVFENEKDKDTVAMMVRELVQLHEAESVLMVSEMWMLPHGISVSEARALYARYGAVSKMPQRIEGVVVTIETRYGQHWQATAPTVRNGRVVKLGAVTYKNLAEEAEEFSGRFAGWFAPEKPSPVSPDYKGPL